MDNRFVDEDGGQQARRRRFQTGLLVVLLLFFMDSRQPQDAQRRSKRNAENKITMAKTVKKLAKYLQGISQGDAVALRDTARIEAEWRKIDAKDVQTVVPAMEKAASGANRSKPFEVRPDGGNDTIDSFGTENEGSTVGNMWRSDIKGDPDVSAVQGFLKLGKTFTGNSWGGDAAFEGLFFHRFGHMSAVVGVDATPLKLVWDTVAPNASVEDRLAFGAVGDGGGGAAASNVTIKGGRGGNESSAVDDSNLQEANGDYTVDEDSAKRERVLRMVGGAGPGQGRNNRAFSGGGKRSGRAQSEATDWVTWAASEDRLAGGAGERLRGRAGERYGLRRAQGGQWGEVLEQGERAPRGRAQPSHGREEVANDNETRNRDGGGGRRRHLEAAEVTPAPSTAKLLLSAEDIAVAESGVALQTLDPTQSPGIVPVAAMEADEGAAKGELADGVRILEEFPAMVLPKGALVGPDQDSGPLPSQFFSLSRTYRSDCLYLLTLQTHDSTGGGDKDKRGTDDRPPKTWVEKMKGELVGVNCNFSAEIEVQLGVASGQNHQWSYPAMIFFFCLLHMCFLCCRTPDTYLVGQTMTLELGDTMRPHMAKAYHTKIGFILTRRRYGRNFLVPRRFQPPKFDYHRPIPPELAEQVSRETAGGQDSEEGRDIEAGNLMECAICYASVEGALQDYMLTPCDHVFHQGCLMRWMDVKMECPTCRRELPPPQE